MAKWPIVGYDGDVQINGVTNRYAAFGGDHQDNSTEANVQQEVRDTYTASNLRLYLSSWVGGAGVDDMIATFRVNGAGGNQTITINATGEHEDITNTDGLVSGDLINAHFDHSAGGHSDEYTVETFQVTLDASTDVPPLMAAHSGLNGWLADNNFVPLIGGGFASATEANVEYTMRSTRTLIDFRVWCGDHTGGSDPTLTVRKNQADPASGLSISVTGTGEFLDTTNSVSYAAGDEANLGATNVATRAEIRIVSVEADTSSGLLCFAGFSVSASTNYLAPSSAVETTTEANAQVEAEAAASIKNLCVTCSSNAETRTIRTRKNAANGAVSVSVTGTGIFEDTTNSDSLAAEDDLAIQQDAGSSGTNSYLAVVEWETAVAVDAFEAARQFGSVQPVQTPVEIIAY